MAKKTTIEAIVKLYSKLGGNLSDVLGTRSNVNFMGLGKSSEPFLDMDLNLEALGAISKSKALDELKSSVGFATAEKLNDVQANKLLTNMMRMDEFYNPPAVTNITDMATGTRNLDAEGLASLRGMTDETADVPFPEVENLPRGVGLRKALPDEEKSALMTRLDDIVKRKQADAAKTTPFDEAVEYNARPEDVVQNLVDQKFGIGYFDNVGSTPAQRGSAREFLVEALKKENPNETNFADIIDAVDVKYITEGGGGLAGDPLTIVNKYFGPRIAEMVPSGASSEEIAIFTERVLNNVVDANGLRPGDPRFDRLTAKFTENFADGGIAGLETRQGLRFGGKAVKNILSKINKKMIQDAADDIFPTGDYKYDAEMVVESLVENNPKLFKNLLAEDLDDVLRSELYGLAVDETGSRAATAIKANRAIKPVKSAESMKKTGTIDISDPEIADEVTTYIKETDPQGYEKLKKGAFGEEVQSMDEFMGYPQGTIQPTRISDEGLKRIYMESLETGEFRGSFEDFKIYADQVLGLGRKPNARGGLAKILEV